MNELVTELGHAMLPHKLFEISLFGYHIPIYDTIITMWIIMAFLTVVAFVLGRNMQLVPGKVQNVGEILVDSINGMTKDAIGHHWKGFAPYIGTIILFLGFANISAIFNIIPSWSFLSSITGIESLKNLPEYHIRPPSKDINVTASMAIMSILLVIGASIRYHKFSGFLKSFLHPIPILAPFKVLEYFIKPLSLCLRLFGNILAAFTIMELIYFAAKSLVSFFVPAVIPAFFSLYFDLFDGLLQAYIFSFLTSLYIGEAVEEEE